MVGKKLARIAAVVCFLLVYLVLADPPLQAGNDEIFSDGFETGHFTEWSSWNPICFEIHPGPTVIPVANFAYQTDLTSPILGGPDPDQLSLEFYDSAVGVFSLDGSNYSTCMQCILVTEDNGSGKTFFQESGMLTVDPTSQPLNSILDAALEDVTLIEVTIDPDTFVSTPVPGGDCLHISLANVSTP